MSTFTKAITAYPSTNAEPYTLVFDVYEKTFSNEDNTSVVAWSVKLRSNNSAFSCTQLTGAYNLNVTIDGVKVGSVSGGTLNLSYGNPQTLLSGTKEISHNTDGSKNVSCSAAFTNVRTDNYVPRSGTASGNLKLTDIPRASSVSVNANEIEMGNSITITLEPALSTFTHKLYYSFEDGQYVDICDMSAGSTSKSWTVPSTFASSIPNTDRGIITIKCETYNSDKLIGEKTTNFTAVLPSSYVPSINDPALSESVSGIAQAIGAFVQNRSQIKFKISASGSEGSTVSSCTTSFDGVIYNGTEFVSSVVKNSGTINAKITVVDSRGRSNIKVYPVEILEYKEPVISVASANRCLSDGTIDEAEGTYGIFGFSYKIYSLNNKNLHSFKIQYSLNKSSWTDLYSNSSNYELNDSYRTTSGLFTATNTYYIRYICTDYFRNSDNPVVILLEIHPTYSLINFGENGKSISFGGQSSNDGTFENFLPLKQKNAAEFSDSVSLNGNSISISSAIQKILGNLFFPVGSVYITYTNQNPGNFLGGTWTQFGQGRTLIGQGTGNDGSTSMSFTAGSTGGEYNHTLTTNEIPSHNHTLYFDNGQVAKLWQISTRFSSGSQSAIVSYGTSNNYPQIANTGGGGSHNNIQPYITVYFWRRTS